MGKQGRILGKKQEKTRNKCRKMGTNGENEKMRKTVGKWEKNGGKKVGKEETRREKPPQTPTG